MNLTTRISKAERVGRWLARGWRGYLHSEREVSGWLVAQGLPAPIVSTLLWIVTLAVVVGLLYTAFWLALLLVFAVVATWTADKNRSDGEFALQYPATIEELRNTPGYDPSLHEDTSHEMYRDD
ncbi:DUF3742 family protein [Paenalcaligenes niemegkensis]|uniref:DUF3742 family protein n=1 Tax=Paenalcaligenes niemegkensis TaxID=2895469 RepID=UPI001EE80770|nr:MULTISPECIES: DUF3742 family protein [Alcaligenaceae]MCQ9617358.1 DUF3742 family protein [Paenalcaligenes niemegkensis]